MHFFAREMSFFFKYLYFEKYIFFLKCLYFEKYIFFDFEIHIKSSRAPIYNKYYTCNRFVNPENWVTCPRIVDGC